MSLDTEALDYHALPTPGKLAIVSTKPCQTARDLSLAYSPGVAAPCLEIAENPELVYKYTSKGNLVAVITNGTAVLGLGNIGPAAAKPVMEGKAVLFKSFADIDVFDLELNCATSEQFIDAVTALGPTFGGINLEDIKAPECFDIEQELAKRLDIPVFHDDQHGTAIIAGAAFLNAVELSGRCVEKVKMVINGAGAAAISCARLLLRLGVVRENIILCDSKGVVFTGRKDGMNKYKEEFATSSPTRTLAEAIKGADVFFGLSSKDVLLPEMLLTMADNPIVFAMANPDPEITYPLAKATRSDVIMATGRSDYPNQVNNVLGFPFIFRGALDVQASSINEEMKIAAVHALAKLAKEPVPESVRTAYEDQYFSFGFDYLIPKPFDPRALEYVAGAVAEAAMASGVARRNIDPQQYRLSLRQKTNQGREILRSYYGLAHRSMHKKVAFAEGENERIIKAAIMALEEGIAEPILLGNESRIRAVADSAGVSLKGVRVLTPQNSPQYQKYVETYYKARHRKGVTKSTAEHLLRSEHIFANLMLIEGEADAVISGVDRHYSEAIRPILDIVELKPGVSVASALYILSIKSKVFFLTDVALNVDMTSTKLAGIAVMAAEFAKSMNIDPQVAMLSFSNFGSVKHPLTEMTRAACELAREKAPWLKIDGEMQADTAVSYDLIKGSFPFCSLDGPANVLVFPDMQSGNIAYKLLQRLAGASVVGPIVLGLKYPSHVVQHNASVDEIFNLITVAVAQASLNSGSNG